MNEAKTVIEIFGTGCKKCKKTMNNALQAIDELGIKAEVIKIEDINEIANRGVMLTPTLAINGDPKVIGKVAKLEEIKKLLQK